MLMQKRITVWCFETASEALLIGVLLIVSWASAGPDPFELVSEFAAVFFATLLFFCTTGYLLTTAIADALCRNKRIWIYPSTASILFSIHLQILVLITKGWTSPDLLPVRLAGPCIAFVCTFTGSFFLKRKADVSPHSDGRG